jgi:type IV pilus assembly protein PilF
MSNLKITALALVLQITIVGCVSEQTVVEGTRGGQTEVGSDQQARTRMSLGLTYLQRGENDQAIFNLEKAKELAPDMPEIWNALAYYYQQVDEIDLAEDAYRTALRKDSNNADTYNNFGAFLCQHGKYKQAEELLLAAVKLPGYIRVADSYENLAYCSLEQDDFAKYKQYLLSSLKHSSSRQTAVYNVAMLEYAMGNMVEAKKWQTRLQNLGQVSAPVTLLRYLIAYRTGDSAEQQEAEKFLVSVFPTSKEAGMVLAGDFRESEPDKLRQRFKSSLMGQAKAAEEPAEQVAAPKMKIVKRKGVADESAPQAMPKEEPLPEEVQLTSAPDISVPDSSSAELPAISSENLASATAPNAISVDPAEELLSQTPADEVQATPNNQATSDAKAATGLDTAQNPLASDATVANTNATENVTNPTTYVVKAGDTLYRIASRFRLSVSELQQLNKLSDASMIREGMTLKIAKQATGAVPATYQVNAGDTLFSIAFKFNVSMDTLLELNNLTPGQELTPGQTLNLQASEPSSL